MARNARTGEQSRIEFGLQQMSARDLAPYPSSTFFRTPMTRCVFEGGRDGLPIVGDSERKV